jgi:hypothetical protein
VANLLFALVQTVQSSFDVSSSMDWLSICICCTGLTGFSVSEQLFGDVADVEGEMDGPFGGKTCLHLFLSRDGTTRAGECLGLIALQ